MPVELHPDVLAVQRVARLDTRIDEAIATIRALEDGIRVAVERVKAGRAERERLDEEIAAVRAEEEVKEQRIASYARKRDRTRDLIDTGRAPDFLVAQRQLQQCSDIVDETELELLELMEQREALEAERGRVQDQLAIDEGRWKAARTRRDAERPPLEAEVRTLRPAREGAWAELPADLHGAYESLRRKEQPVLVTLRDGVCSHCHISARAQTVIEVTQQKAAHRCRGCSAFILDAVETELPEDDDGDGEG